MSIAKIGDNNAPDAFTLLCEDIDLSYGEAVLWLDGEAITSPEIAEGVMTLMRDLQAKGKLAEGMRKAEKKPHDDAGKAVQEKYKPLSEQVKRAVDACKEALLPYERKQHELATAEAEKLQAEALAAEQEARAALRSVDKSNIAATEAVEEQLKESQIQTAVAKKFGRETGGTKVAGERKLGIRTDYIPSIENRLEALMHYYSVDPSAFDEVMLRLARQDVIAGVREIPGFTIETKEQVI